MWTPAVGVDIAPAVAAEVDSGQWFDAFILFTQAMTPLAIATVSGIWGVWKYLETRRAKDEDDETVVQGKAVPVEWTWQDELKAHQIREEQADSREHAFRERLVELGVKPSQVLEEAGLLPSGERADDDDDDDDPEPAEEDP